MTSGRPFTSAIATLAHWPCRTLSPGELSVQTTLPVFLLKQTIAGACGATTFLCVSSTPLPVMT